MGKGSTINVNGQTYVWDEKTRDYGHWVRINGRSVFIPMTNEEAAQAVVIGVEKLVGKPHRLPTHASKDEIVAEMLQEERRVRVRLKELGRVILDDAKRENHDELREERHIPRQYKPNYSLDIIRNGILIRRNFYDEFGELEQEIDYEHQDTNGRHIFPHIHVWFEDGRSAPIAYRTNGNVKYSKRNDVMTERKNINGELPDFMIAGFSFDRRCKNWREQNGVDRRFMDKFDTDDLEGAVSTIKDVQALMSYNWEFSVKYKDCDAHFCRIAQTFYIDADCGGKKYEFATDDLNEFKKATVGPYKLKDIVDKWTITDFV